MGGFVGEQKGWQAQPKTGGYNTVRGGAMPYQELARGINPGASQATPYYQQSGQGVNLGQYQPLVDRYQAWRGMDQEQQQLATKMGHGWTDKDMTELMGALRPDERTQQLTRNAMADQDQAWGRIQMATSPSQAGQFFGSQYADRKGPNRQAGNIAMPEGDQLGNIFRQYEFAGAKAAPELLAFADRSDAISNMLGIGNRSVPFVTADQMGSGAFAADTPYSHAPEFNHNSGYAGSGSPWTDAQQGRGSGTPFRNAGEHQLRDWNGGPTGNVPGEQVAYAPPSIPGSERGYIMTENGPVPNLAGPPQKAGVQPLRGQVTETAYGGYNNEGERPLYERLRAPKSMSEYYDAQQEHQGFLRDVYRNDPEGAKRNNVPEPVWRDKNEGQQIQFPSQAQYDAPLGAILPAGDYRHAQGPVEAGQIEAAMLDPRYQQTTAAQDVANLFNAPPGARQLPADLSQPWQSPQRTVVPPATRGVDSVFQQELPFGMRSMDAGQMNRAYGEQRRLAARKGKK